MPGRKCFEVRPNQKRQILGHTAFGKGSLVFPLKNKDGQIVGMYFRETDDKKQNHHYYLQNRQGLYPKYPGQEARHLIITESIIDAATMMLVPEITNNYQGVSVLRNQWFY